MTTMLLRWHNHSSHHGIDKRIERSLSLLLRLCPDDGNNQKLDRADYDLPRQKGAPSFSSGLDSQHCDFMVIR